MDEMDLVFLDVVAFLDQVMRQYYMTSPLAEFFQNIHVCSPCFFPIFLKQDNLTLNFLYAWH